MKYLQTAQNDRVLQRRLFFKDPRTIISLNQRNNVITHEIEEVDAEAIGIQLDSIESGGYATYDGTTLTIISALDAASTLSFKQQLQVALRGQTAAVRSQVISLIAPGFALNDPDVMLVGINTFDDSGASAKIQKLKADLIVVIGREIAKRNL